MKTLSKRVVLIAGPTASGKSKLALDMAQRENGVIINADSMQVYKELRVLTARPTTQDEALASHRLYGHVAGDETYSVARWLSEVKVEIDKALEAGKTALVCGGTGLYFLALEQGIADVPAISPQITDHWRSFEGDLHAELKLRDQVSAAKLHPADRQRLIRALAVVDGTGISLPEWQKRAQARSALIGFNVQRFYQQVERQELYARADARFETMLESGALEELHALPYLSPKAPLMKAIGVPELMAYLRGEKTFAMAKAEAQTATRNYIKRQLTWWRGQMKGWKEVS